jgi:cell division protein FtsW (lipid II flippase)
MVKLFLKAVIAAIFNLLFSVLTNFYISDLGMMIITAILFLVLVLVEGMEIEIINA